MFLDFKLDPGAVMEQSIPIGWAAFVYILAGQAKYGRYLRVSIWGKHI